MWSVTQFCRVSRVEALFCLELPGVKQKPKNIRGFSKNMSSTLSVLFFLWKGPLWYWFLISHIPNTFAVNIFLKMGKSPSYIAFYKLFLSEIKMKVLINSWYFLMSVFEYTLCPPLSDTLSFSKWKVLRSYTYRESFSDISYL